MSSHCSLPITTENINFALKYTHHPTTSLSSWAKASLDRRLPCLSAAACGLSTPGSAPTTTIEESEGGMDIIKQEADGRDGGGDL